MLDIETEIRKGIMFVRIGGELSQKTIKKWNDDVKSLMLDNGITNMVFNVSNLKLIDTKGINSLLFSYEMCKKNHGSTLLCGLNDNVRTKMRHSRLLKYIPEANDELDALSIINV